jgi:hypothetical protein
MTQYWWVNHNQTARQEIEGQYLWSPKTKSNGARNQFYLNMRRATPGDIVLSYFDQAIRYVGRVAEFAFTAPKPEEFGETGAYWDNEGWLLPVFWTPLAPAVRPKALIGALAPNLPKRFSPIHPVTAAGYQSVYLAEIPEPVFETIVASASYNVGALARGGSNSLTFQVVTEILDDLVERRIAADARLDSTTRSSVIQARRGQGKFRSNVEAIERSCRLTGITNPSLLIASHIKPWRLCETAQERLDGMNGLMLTPDADLLFDRGFISFEDDGAVKVSPRADRMDLRRLGFEELAWENYGFGEASATWQSGLLAAGQCTYMDYHRSQVFVA